MPNQLKCQLCQKQISDKYYSLWKITKGEWDKIPLGEKETHKIFNYHPSCYEENTSEETLKIKGHIEKGNLTLTEETTVN